MKRGPVRCRADDALTASESAFATGLDRATVGVVSSVPEALLSRLVAAGDGRGIVDAFDVSEWAEWAEEDAADILGKEWSNGWAVGAEGLVEIPEDLTVLARIAARKRTGDLIKSGLHDVDRLRRAVTDTVGFGWSIPKSAQVIRGMIGLDDRSMTALNRYAVGLEEAGVPEPQFRRQVDAYHQRLLRARSRRIARTEVQTAVNAGRHAAYDRALSVGALGPGAVKEWITAHDDRLCPTCAPMDGEKAPLTDSFSHGAAHPPRHPSCRCTFVIADVGLRSLSEQSLPGRRKYSADDPDVIETARRYGVSPDEVLTARRDVAGVKRLIANDAAEAQREAFAVLDGADALRLRRPPKVRRGSEYDWMEQISKQERSRLSRRWFSDSPVYAPDLIAESFGLDVDEAMQKWLWATRQVEAAGAIRRGKLPSARAYSGRVDPQEFARTHAYDIEKVLGARSDLDAAGYIAQHHRALLEEDAYRMLGPAARPVHGPAPFQMGYQSWEGELLDLDYEIRTGTATRAQEARYRELLPWDLDDPEASLEECYARIVYTARLSGEEVADHARIPWAD